MATWDFLRTTVNQTLISVKGADSSELLPGQLRNRSGIVALAGFGCVAPGSCYPERNVSGWALRAALFLQQGGSELSASSG